MAWRDATDQGDDTDSSLTDVLENVSDLVQCVRPDGSLRYANRAWREALGYAADELERLTFLDTIHPSARPAAADLFQSVRIGGPPQKFETTLLAKDGHGIAADGLLLARLEDGQAPAAQCIYRAKTERPGAHSTERGGEEGYRRLIEASPDAIFISRDQRIVFVNPACLKLLNATAVEHLLGKSPFDIIHPDYHLRARARMRQALESGQAQPMSEMKVARLDGTEVDVEIAATGFADAEGPALLMIARDITERKFAEERRWQLKARIRHAQKLESLGLLAGGIAHDFNNLLTAMLGYAHLARLEVPEDSSVAPMLDEIEKAAQRAAELSQQMLAYSGKGKFVLRVMRLDALVREMARLLETAVSRNATLKLELEPAALEGDPTQIRQIIMNLITNASDALEGNAGVITLRTRVRHMTAEELRSPFRQDNLPEGDYAWLEVADTGCGMGEETISCIFDPFFTTKFTGRGLGLAAVLGIVRGHRGAIKVTSTPGEGSLFEVYFPAVADVPEEPPAPRTLTTPWRGQGVILVIDDEASVRSLSRRILENAGVEVFEAADGVEGLEVYARNRDRINCILLDLTMPRMDGLEFLRQLTGQESTLPVVLMSGFSEQEAASRAAGLRVSGYMQKPFQHAELLRRVGEMLAVGAGS